MSVKEKTIYRGTLYGNVTNSLLCFYFFNDNLLLPAFVQYELSHKCISTGNNLLVGITVIVILVFCGVGIFAICRRRAKNAYINLEMIPVIPNTNPATNVTVNVS